MLITDSTKIQQACQWKPQYSNLETIVQHAWNAKKNHATKNEGDHYA